MVETENPEEPTFSLKRKPDVRCEENEEHPNKAQKLQSLNNDSELSVDKTQDPDEKRDNSDAQLDNNEEDEEDNGEVVVDRKGKGIMIEEDDDDDDSSDDNDDDSSDGGSISDCESDLSDDPLAEVDLDNILPSRTRRRIIQPGEFIASDGADDDSDSDDDDA